MARIVFGSYFIRYPLGGMMSHVLQYLVGFQRLGHDVYFVEKAGYPNSCFDPRSNSMGDDCSFGMSAASSLLNRFDLAERWCFVDAHGGYHGLERKRIEAIFAETDIFIDMGTHGTWLEEAASSGLRVLIDGEPGFNQIKMAKSRAAGERLHDYDAYFTVGANVGTDLSPAPHVGRLWRHLFHPVVVDLFAGMPSPADDAPFTTLMNWQSHDPIEYQGARYGQKDVEFEKFGTLPRRVRSSLVLAASGRDVPAERLRKHGWKLHSGHGESATYDSFTAFIAGSAGEFSVCKNVFVEFNTGWFSDRSAAYLASGRPVILQDTGFSAHLPTGEGLFAVTNIDEAAAAIEEINLRPHRHQVRAREIARDHLDAEPVLRRFLEEASAQASTSAT